MSAHAERLRHHTATRYLAAVAAVAVALLLRMLLEPVIGSGAHFVLAFAAVLVVSLFVGVGPGALTLALSLPFTAYLAIRAGTSVSQALIQALLYAVDGLIILYVASVVTKKRRSLDDANRELRRLTEALHRAVADRNDVLRIVAHDLRNPLSTIMMEAHILEAPGLVTVPRDVPAAQVIMRSVTRMNQLIQDLLDVALVEAGELRVEQARHSAATVAREAVDSQATIAADSKIEIRLEIDPNVRDVWCDCDHKRLLQVFENLIGNAIKFTEAGGRITVRAVSQEHDVLFSVADTGSGIEAESLPHVFDRFWQAATHARHMGAGLGLPVAKGIVEAHGGRMWVESVPGRGSTFYFTIPASDKAR